MPNIDSMCYLILLLCTANVLLFSFTPLMTSYARICVSNTLTHSNVSVYFVLLHCLFLLYLRNVCVHCVPNGLHKVSLVVISECSLCKLRRKHSAVSFMTDEYLCSDNILPLVLASAKQMAQSLSAFQHCSNE